MSLSSLSLDLSFPRFLQRVVPSSISLQQSKKIEERRENRRSITFRILCSRNYSHANKTNMLKVQYKTDCQKFYGRILDNRNVVSVVEGTSKQKTAEIWSSLYPLEPYELAFNITFSEGGAEKFSECVENIKYDLVSAVRGQIVFFYQVSRPSMHDDCFLERAVAGYKGLKFISETASFPTADKLFRNKIWVGTVEGLPVYFIEPHHLAKFFWRGQFYGE